MPAEIGRSSLGRWLLGRWGKVLGTAMGEFFLQSANRAERAAYDQNDGEQAEWNDDDKRRTSSPSSILRESSVRRSSGSATAIVSLPLGLAS